MDVEFETLKLPFMLDVPLWCLYLDVCVTETRATSVVIEASIITLEWGSGVGKITITILGSKVQRLMEDYKKINITTS